MPPTVVILGRPNVGKSTLFNRLAGRRVAIVDNTPGVTRDRKEAPARIGGRDVLLVDTAGLRKRARVTEDLEKMSAAASLAALKECEVAVLVLDATTGQNALNQVETFRKLADVSGLVMTKLDGTARGGVLVALADRFGLPIHAIGVGEQIDDLDAFDPGEFARALVGL